MRERGGATPQPTTKAPVAPTALPAAAIDLLPFDGNEAEVKTHIENLDRLRRMLPTKRLVYAADQDFVATLHR